MDTALDAAGQPAGGVSAAPAGADTIQLTADGFRWEVRADYAARLLDPDGLRLAAWIRDGRAEPVKSGPHRSVYRVDTEGVRFYLKHYPLADVRAWLRQLVRPSKARTEYERALGVAARGVPTFVPLALGERCSWLGPAESYLLTHSLEGAAPLNSFIESTIPRLPRARRVALRQRLAQELGGLAARMHEAGVLHNDLHAANLLVRLLEDDTPELFLIDLHAVRLLDRPLDWRRSHANLVILNRWFTLRSGKADRLRFWHAYFSGRGEEIRRCWKAGVLGRGAEGRPDDLAGAELAHHLEKRTWQSNLAFWRGRDRRCLARNRYFQPVRGPSAGGRVVTDLDRGFVATLAADPDAPFRVPGVNLLKDSRSSTVAEIEVTLGGVVRRAIYKRFRVTSWADPWANLVRRSPALRSWLHGHGLRERCLPTARPLAVLSRRRLGLQREGYLLTEKIEDAAELHAHLASLEALPASEKQRQLRERIDDVARLVRDLHRRQLSHRDLKAANLLVGPSGSSAYGGVWLIDLVGVELHRNLSRARRVQNLARLNASFVHSNAVSLSDRLRFLRVYLQWGLRGRDGWKMWWRAVERATREKVERNLRRRRPLA